MVSGKSVVECPFCKRVCITAFHKPSFLEGRTSRISAGSQTTFRRVAETYFIQGDCSKCGRKNKDIQAWHDGRYKEKKLTHEERIRRTKEAGIADAD